ncbi:MAG: exodeoxyribonuclease VII large subunit, partial [Patescibacteria group bacterium]|nr:exodeoxyribonuclease VII large subunit [Patescibacteria group bacterium]
MALLEPHILMLDSPSLFDQPPSPEDSLTVSQLTAQVKELLESAFPMVWVKGEISGLARPRSGHVYLTLKDERAQIRAVLWRAAAERLRFDLADGQEVLCRGNLAVYAPRGEYQLAIQKMEPAGMGALELAFRQLREKLGREGLFDPARKKPLPRFARRIAVVTSPSGAAVRDFLQVLNRRWRGADVLIIPTRVQGQGASVEIAAAVKLAASLNPPPDCIVVTRGGGSLEDLWAFNEEPVVRAVAASTVPVVSAVGHEIDVTLCDLAADVRALTPSQAAELLAPDASELLAALSQARRRLAGALRARLADGQSRLRAIEASSVFRRPMQLIEDRARTLDELEQRSGRAVRQRTDRAGQRVEKLSARLDALSPLAVLARGYSVTQRTDDGTVVRNSANLAPGDLITTRF